MSNSENTATTATAPRIDFARILLGEYSEAEVEERYLALAKALFLSEEHSKHAA